MHLSSTQRSQNQDTDATDRTAHLNSVHRDLTRAEEVGFFERWTSLIATLASGEGSVLGRHLQTDPCEGRHQLSSSRTPTSSYSPSCRSQSPR